MKVAGINLFAVEMMNGKWLDSGHILQILPMGFADWLNKGHYKKYES